MSVPSSIYTSYCMLHLCFRFFVELDLTGHFLVHNHLQSRRSYISNRYTRILLVQLHMDPMEHKATRNEISRAITHLPNGLRDTYDETMRRIDEQKEEDGTRA